MYWINKIKQITLSVVLAAGLSTAVAAPAAAQLYGGSKGDACSAVGAGTRSGKCKQGALNKSSTRLSTTIKNIINVISIIVGIAAVIMLIISGFRYVTSGGDSNNITAAKHTFIYALVGLVIVALAQTIVKYVLSNI